MSRELNMQNIDSIDGYTFEQFVGGGNKVFEIPLFQRNYSWDKDSCEQIFNDIIGAYNRGETYYIGNFMFYRSPDTTPKFNKFILIDGQQRVTTLLLLLCAMRDNFSELKNIDNDFLTNDNSEETYKFKLKQNYNDYDDFLEIMNCNRNDEKKSNIYVAYNTFVDLINDDPNINSDNINDIYNSIKGLESIGIEIKCDNNDIKKVQDIFEKINSTGVELSPADLIRNFLLFSSTVQTQKYLHDNYWKRIEENVGEKNISKFAKSFLIRYTYEDVSNEKIYFKFKKHFRDMDHESILELMLRYSTFFSMIEQQKFYEIINNDYNNIQEYNFNDHNNQTTKKYNQLIKLRTTFLLLNKIGTDEVNPLFFQLCDGLYYTDLDRLNDICELILEFMIRYRIVPVSGGGGALSNRIRTIMEKISNGECQMTKKDIYAALTSNENSEASRYPDNAEFVEALKKSITIKNAKVLLYQFARRKGEELPSFDSNITVEHLMPQTINPKENDGKWWINNLGGLEKWKDTYDEYINSIGNMVLLSRKLNASISNGTWDVKKEAIKEKAMDKSARKVATKYSKWTKSQMKSRNNSFSKEICRVITGPKYEKKFNPNWL